MSKKQALKSELGKSYANALLSLAVEAKNHDLVKKNLLDVKQMIQDSKDLQKALNNRLIDRKQLEDAINAIFKKAGISELVTRFVKVMVENGRAANIVDAVDEYIKLQAAVNNEVLAKVTTAAKINDKQLADITGAVQKLTDKKVIVAHKVDEKIMGGLVVELDSKMIDASVKGKMERLKIFQKSLSFN